jgi:tetratricopeptide (TPR) repeat protein
MWRAAVVLLITIAVIFGVWRVVSVRSRLVGVLEQGKTSRDWFETGRGYLQHRDRKGNVDNAIQAFRQALAADGQNAAAWASLGETYLYQNQVSPDTVSLNLARSSAAKAVELNNYLAAGHTVLGEAELAAGELEPALREIRRALVLDPRDAAANTALGDFYARQQKNPEAEQAYRHGVGLAPNDWYWNTRLGMFLQARGRYAEAAAVYEHARESDPDNAVVNRNLGATYFGMDRFDDAASAFQRALGTNPSAILFTNLGTLFFYQGRYPEAVDAFERAVRLDANRYRIWGNLADAYRWAPGSEAKAAEAYGEAIRLVRQAIAKTPADVNLTSQLATFLAKSGKKQEALKEIAGVHSGQPAPVLVRAAMVEELCGERTKALAWLRQAIQAGYSAKELNSEPEFTELRKDPEYHRMQSNSTR